MTDSETYEGWTNRETWAVALHINNDQGWQEGVHEALREGMVSKGESAADEGRSIDGTLTPHEAGEIIHESVKDVLSPNYVHPDAFQVTEAAWLARCDIGSMWRVDWSELGAAFLADLTD